MTLLDLITLLGTGFDATWHFIGTIKLWQIGFWLIAGPILWIAWWRVLDSIHDNCRFPSRSHKQHATQKQLV